MTTHSVQATRHTLDSPPARAGLQAAAVTRLLYIDNIRTFLTILVLLHHIMITYAGSGSWLYTENRQDLATEVVGNIFCTVNQAFFMGFFLLISAYFVPGAYDRKGSSLFLKDRLIRLGIPLVVYSWLIHPLYMHWFLRTTEGMSTSFWSYYTRQYFNKQDMIGQGPLWFVETLLIFTIIYVAWRLFSRNRFPDQTLEGGFPTNRMLVLFALGMALASFFVRLIIPVGWRFTLLNLQLTFFAQYIAMFIFGLWAYRQNWYSKLPDSTGRFWLRVTAVVVLMYVPGALLGGALESDLPFKGGWTWQSLYFSAWEAFLCLGLCVGILYIFRRYLNHQSSFVRFLSQSAYAAYIIQVPILVTVTLQLRSLELHPLLKFALAALIAVPLCFAIGGLVRRLPYADKVL
jgi:glucans biosynthesis protein C